MVCHTHILIPSSEVAPFPCRLPSQHVRMWELDDRDVIVRGAFQFPGFLCALTRSVASAHANCAVLWIRTQRRATMGTRARMWAVRKA
ncbi:unnamed protein product, partial [Iphiclides podalirius]